MALDRWIAPAVLAAALGAAAFAPTPAKAQSADELTRFRGDQPYYRYGDYGSNDRLMMRLDAYGRPVYYRVVDNGYRTGYRDAPPYGRAVGYYNQPSSRAVKCNKNGKCKAEYYDPRYDHKRYGYGR